MKFPGISKLFGSRSERYVKRLQPLVTHINGLEEEVQALSDAQLKNTFLQLRQRHEKGVSLEELLPEAFACTREAARRTLGERPYDVQLIGGMILHQGKITEMKTGEGKTLTASLAASLNALTGQGVHMVTVNDYLARRDAEWMRPVYEALGLSVASVTGGMEKAERREAYQADITYCTNNEIGFDYLRDNMAFEEAQLAQRGQPYAIVDEVDSILIDEARTPLIISGPTDDRTELYIAIDKFMDKFQEGEDYEADEKFRSVSLTDAGTDKAEHLLQAAGFLEEGENLYDIQHVSLVHHLGNALRAHRLFHRDIQYIVKDDQVVLIDEFTGRMTPGRRLGDGLHQAIEAKEGVTIQQENQTLASVTYQNYFRLYQKLAGMTGTAETEAEEFATIYNLDVIVVPTNVTVQRVDEADIVFRKRQPKLDGIIADIQDSHGRGQPVLVGTTSIEKSEELSRLLKSKKIPHEVLNARHHEREAEIIAQAGRKGAVTIATNMAGRGTDIKLGGNLELLLEQAADEKAAGNIRTAHAKEKAAVLEAGGLRVIGTERHESRRIDNQLRGRSGRQGDPGSSAFYLSLEDDLMRIFATNLDALMGRFNMPEDESIQHPWISKSIETAQKKIEGMHFDARKHVLKFDNILNEQRKVIYEQRRDMLHAEKVDDIVQDFRHDVLELLFDRYLPADVPEEHWDADGLREEVVANFAAELSLAEWLQEKQDPDTVYQQARQVIDEAWQEKENRIGGEMMRRLEKFILLQVIDRQWRSHLQQLDHLRQGINLRGYAQKDPINEFSREAFHLFEEMLTNIRMETTLLLSRAEVEPQDAALLKQGPSTPIGEPAAVEGQNISIDPKTPRNAPCPCGSGKKFKHCHGKLS
jgi:preprotein translocase subunit SecA